MEYKPYGYFTEDNPCDPWNITHMINSLNIKNVIHGL